MAFKITKIIANYGGCDLPQVLRLEVAYDNKALESVVTLEFDEDPFPTIRTFDGQPRDLRIDIARENTWNMERTQLPNTILAEGEFKTVGREEGVYRATFRGAPRREKIEMMVTEVSFGGKNMAVTPSDAGVLTVTFDEEQQPLKPEYGRRLKL